MSGRRTEPLVAVVLIGAVVVLLRLFQVQVLEHEIWANEAANLMRTSRVVPYDRGRIWTSDGRLLVRDRAAYHLSFTYRDFRRAHPLGQVAHAWSALLGQALSLEDVHADLERWALELVRLSPSQIDAFGRGEGLRTPSFSIAPRDERTEPEAARQRRAADALYYAAGLLELGRRENYALRRARRTGEPLPGLVELVASWNPGLGPADVEARLRERLADSERALERLAELLAPTFEEGAGERSGVGPAPVARLVRTIEARRRGVEDAIASRLFLAATGFAPGRVQPGILWSRFDLGWLARDLYWEDARLAQWVEGAQPAWRARWRDGYALEHLLAEIVGAAEWEERPDRALSLLLAVHEPAEGFEAALDGEPVRWREVDELAVFERLAGIFDEDAPDALLDASRPRLACQTPEARGQAWDAATLWGLLETWGGTPPDATGTMPELLEEHRAKLRATGRSSTRALRERLRELAGRLLATWDAQLQAELDLVLAEMADSGKVGDGRVHLREDLLKRRNRRHWIKDYGSRPMSLTRAPDYEVVYLLTRFRDRYPGFDVIDARERVHVLAPDEQQLPAPHLIGHVSMVDARDIQEQRELRRQVAALRRNARRSAEEDALLAAGVAEMLLADEVKGVSGIEAGWDRVLRGRNGYREVLSLEDVYGEGPELGQVREPEHGLDVVLTVSATVQRAAERTLAHPERPEYEDDPIAWQESWFDAPVGAIVLATVEGDLIAAASHGLPPGTGVDEDDPRARDIDRVLRKPAFQPPGSVFKPFVALWGLQQRGLDPHQTVDCVIGEGDTRAGYKGLRCWKPGGHGPGVDLGAALHGSCNAYFAWLGERLRGDDFRDLADAFGFGHSAGRFAFDGGWGVAEDTVPHLFEDELESWHRLRAGNGLAVVEATPAQMARATAGLATGLLPELRIVRAIGGREVPHALAQELPIEREHLERVREALYGVANGSTGTAFRALNEQRLDMGLAVAVKTGSADLRGRPDGDGEVPKHAWVTGWLPAEDPLAVFVIFCDTTDKTSSHSAVHVARQFLQQPEVRAWVDTALGERGGRQ